MLLCRQGPLAHKPGKTTGCNIFAGLPHCFVTLHAKICYAPCDRAGRQFFRISCRSHLLTEKHKLLYVTVIKAGKRLTENLGKISCDLQCINSIFLN
jgi:hypothetical protein